MYGYIYKTICLINNKIYVGQKKSKKFLGNKYLGSGTAFLSAVNKYGRENFIVELLDEGDSFDDLNAKEIYWIAELHARKVDIGYNIALGGRLNYNVWEHLNDEEKKLLAAKISAGLMGHAVSDNTRKDISDSKLAFYQTQDGIDLKNKLSAMYTGHVPWNKGKVMSDDYCQIVRDSHPKGYFNHSEETKKQISETLKAKFSSGELVQHEGTGKKRCKNLDTGEEFDSLTSAAKKYNLSNANSIVKCSEGKFKTAGGYHWILI